MNTVLKLDIFSDYTAISHAISTQAFGSMKKENGDVHSANLLKFAKDQNFLKMPISMRQVHGTNIAIIENDRELVIPQTDGMITNKKGLPLAIKTADCLPVFFYDPEKQAIGAVHAGRRGLSAGTLTKTIAAFEATFDSNPNDIIVGIGPSIERDCYEVSEEIITEFKQTFPTYKNIYEEKDGKYYLDLRNVALQNLLAEGILEENIAISDICTLHDKRFYSYRRGDRNSLFISVISLL
jgi:YfiH family protein